MYHARLGGSEEVPRVGMDYTFLSEKSVTSKVEDTTDDVGDCMTLLVLKDFWHKSIWTYPVEGKGVTKAEWLSYVIQEDLKTCGLDNCMLVAKSDQEPLIKKLQEEIATRRRESGATGAIIENSKVGDSSTNGRTERAIQEVGGLIRTLKFALEDRTGGGKIELNHPVMPWIAKHAAVQIS